MVIQRWQSVLLLIAVVLMALFSWLSLGQVATPDVTYDFSALGYFPEGEYPPGMAPAAISTWWFFAVSVLSALLPLIAIFTFRHYRLQERLCLIESLILACVIVIGAVLGYVSIDGSQVSWSSTVCAPFISLIATIMAYQRICADHRKLRDADRLR